MWASTETTIEVTDDREKNE